MVLNYSCDQLHRVAASRILSLMINDTKVQKFPESSKISLKMFQKTFILVCANTLIHNALHFVTPLLSHSYRHIGVRKKQIIFCKRQPGQLGKCI